MYTEIQGFPHWAGLEQPHLVRSPSNSFSNGKRIAGIYPGILRKTNSWDQRIAAQAMARPPALSASMFRLRIPGTTSKTLIGMLAMANSGGSTLRVVAAPGS